MQLWAPVRFSTQRSNGADSQFEWPLDLGTISLRRIELRRREDCAQRLANVAIALGELSGYAIDETGRWIVRNKMAHELRGNELRRCRTMRKDIEHHQAIFESAPPRNFGAQNYFFPHVVGARIKKKLPHPFP